MFKKYLTIICHYRTGSLGVVRGSVVWFCLFVFTRQIYQHYQYPFTPAKPPKILDNIRRDWYNRNKVQDPFMERHY